MIDDRNERLIDAAKSLRAQQLQTLVVAPPGLSILLTGSLLLLLFYSMVFRYQLGIRDDVLWVVYGASLVAGVVGFAFSPICGAVLIHLMTGQVEIVELLLVSSVAIQVLNTSAVWRYIDWRVLPSFIFGGLLSVPLGVYFLLHVSSHLFAVLLGGLLVVYGAVMSFHKPVVLDRDWGRFGDFLAGLVGGVTGGFAGFPSALVTIRCSMKGWTKNRQRGVYQPFIMVMQLATLATIHFESSHAVPLSGLPYMPVALLGTLAGLMLFNRLSDRQFAGVLNSLLIVSGAGLMVF